MECMYILLKLKLMAKSHGLSMKSKSNVFLSTFQCVSKCTLYTVDATEYVTAQIDATFHEDSEECKTVS